MRGDRVGSEDSLHAVLRAVVAPRAPVVYTLLDQAVHMTLRIILLKALSIREESVLEVAKQGSATFEARQVRLAHQHHLDQDDYLLCVGLKSHECPRHAIPELAESLRILASHHIEHLLR